MLTNINAKKIFTAIVFGGLVSSGTYFFMPPPQPAYAETCDESYIIRLILYCIDGSTISGGRLTTYCDG